MKAFTIITTHCYGAKQGVGVTFGIFFSKVSRFEASSPLHKEKIYANNTYLPY